MVAPTGQPIRHEQDDEVVDVEYRNDLGDTGDVVLVRR